MQAGDNNKFFVALTAKQHATLISLYRSARYKAAIKVKKVEIVQDNNNTYKAAIKVKKVEIVQDNNNTDWTTTIHCCYVELK